MTWEQVRQRFEQITCRLDLDAPELDDDIALDKPPLIRRAPLLHAPNPDTVIDGETELLRQRRCDLDNRYTEETSLNLALAY